MILCNEKFHSVLQIQFNNSLVVFKAKQEVGQFVVIYQIAVI